MFFYKAALGLCLLLILTCHAVLASARRRGDPRQVRVLHFFRIGLSLSVISYVFRLMQPSLVNHASPAAFLTCLAGTSFLWLGWREHWQGRRERSSAFPLDEEGAAETPPAAAAETGLPRLNAHVHLVLLHAQDEAWRQRRRGLGTECLDTEHLLLGLLREPHSAGVSLLERLEVKVEKVHLELLAQKGPCRSPAGKSPAETLFRAVELSELTEGAQQVFLFAAQEAHRFGEASVGTEHLLLGLLLMGKGKAAAALFQEGVTVEAVRAEMIKIKMIKTKMVHAGKSA